MAKSNWKIKAIIVAIAAAIGGVLYRMGGSGNFSRQARVVGVPLLSCGLLMFLDFRWWIIACIPLMIGAISTYWKKKGTDAMWYHWALHALGLSIAMLPYTIASGHYIGFALRTIILTLAITIWSEKIGNAVVEEFGRGFFTVATIPLLLI
jgi:hypothetical protein